MQLRSGTILSSKSDNQLLSKKKMTSHSEQLADSDSVYEDEFYDCVKNTINNMIHELNDYMEEHHTHIIEAAQITNELYYHMNYYIDFMKKYADVETYRNFAIESKDMYEQLMDILRIDGKDRKTIQFAIDEMSEFIIRTI